MVLSNHTTTIRNIDQRPLQNRPFQQLFAELQAPLLSFCKFLLLSSILSMFFVIPAANHYVGVHYAYPQIKKITHNFLLLSNWNHTECVVNKQQYILPAVYSLSYNEKDDHCNHSKLDFISSSFLKINLPATLSCYRRSCNVLLEQDHIFIRLFYVYLLCWWLLAGYHLLDTINYSSNQILLKNDRIKFRLFWMSISFLWSFIIYTYWDKINCYNNINVN